MKGIMLKARSEDPNKAETNKEISKIQRGTRRFKELKAAQTKEDGIKIALDVLSMTREQLIKKYSGDKRANTMKKEDLVINFLEQKLKGNK